jgi:hypothetical protein
MSNGYLTWRQKLVLRATMGVDYLPLRAQLQANIPTGVYRSLVRRGYLRKHSRGWVITPEGRALNPWWAEEDRRALILENMRKAS